MNGAHVPRHAVLADDLTGAADTGVQFAAEGLATALDLLGTGDPIAVIVVTADSRGLPATDAAARVSTITRHLHGRGVRQLCKTVVVDAVSEADLVALSGALDGSAWTRS